MAPSNLIVITVIRVLKMNKALEKTWTLAHRRVQRKTEIVNLNSKVEKQREKERKET